jgi:Fe-Mn family superoxide dismutase
MRSSAAAKARHLHFSLPKLPYAEDALAPVLSAETLKLHHGKHHKKYVDTLNQLLEKEPVDATSLEEVVRTAKGKLFNNAAQAWNHEFYWHSLSPKRRRPAGALLHRLEQDFGSYEQFADKLGASAIGQFGSGWAWLVEKGGSSK